MDLGTQLRRTALRLPYKEAVIDQGQRYTYEAFNAWVNRIAHFLLSLGIQKGNKVALMMQNSSDFISVFYAIAKIGAVAVPVNFRLTKQEAAYILDHSDSTIAIVDAEYEPMLREIALENPKLTHVLTARVDTELARLQDFSPLEPSVQVSEWDDCELLYTSGTTGKPKGALFDHHRVIHVGMTMLGTMHLSERDRLLHVAPLYHCAELNLFLVSGIQVGATHVLQHHFDPRQVIQKIQSEKITLFFGVPTMYNVMLQHYNPETDDLKSVTRCAYGAAPMAPALVTRSMEMFGTRQFYNLAGLTEGGPNGVCLGPEDHEQKLGTSGKALYSCVARVVDDAGNEVHPGEVGELILNAETMMKEYYKNPEATKETMRGGWLHTGDLATLDEDGFVTIVDRKKDMVISGGENVYSTEVENVLYQHPKILDAAVIGVPDDKWGEVVTAVVVIQPDHDVTLEEIQEFCRKQLAAYKIPRLLIKRDTLPRNPSGKVMKYVLREQYR